MLNSLQLQMCDLQGRFFELSVDKGYKSTDFIKQFMKSDIAKDLDSEYNRLQWSGEEYLIEEVEDRLGKTIKKDNEVFTKDEIYWMGYIYRYWQLLRNEKSAKIIRMAPVQTMKRNYLIFHTMDPEMAIENLIEINNQ